MGNPGSTSDGYYLFVFHRLRKKKRKRTKHCNIENSDIFTLLKVAVVIPFICDVLNVYSFLFKV